MKAAVMRANNAPLELEEVQIDDPGPGEVLLKTAASGICHSDLHVIEGSLPVPPPCILGPRAGGHRRGRGRGRQRLRAGRSRDRLSHLLVRRLQVLHEGRPYLCLSQFAGRPEGRSRGSATEGTAEPIPSSRTCRPSPRRCSAPSARW